MNFLGKPRVDLITAVILNDIQAVRGKTNIRSAYTALNNNAMIIQTNCRETKSKVGVTSHRRLLKLHTFFGKYKIRGGVNIPWKARTTGSRTNWGRTKSEVGSSSHGRLIQ